MLAGLAPGTSRLDGALASLDARSTAGALRALGVGVSPIRQGAHVTIKGRRRFREADVALQCGNSGTTARLILGLLAAHHFSTTLRGDRSLSRRPMRRVAEPLAAMGARIALRSDRGLPLVIVGGPLQSLEWALPVASAQIKSACLLAGVAGEVSVTLHEPAASRDHTERFLRSAGYRVEASAGTIHFEPTGRLRPFDLVIPGDPSSAAFLIARALLAEGGEIRLEGVGVNPSRIGFLEVLARMGAGVRVEEEAERHGEPVGSLVAGPAALRAVEVTAAEVPGVIDEIPILAALAARAVGTSTFRGLAELRVKESDRLALMAENLRALGVEAVAEGDDLIVTGTDRPLAGRVRTGGDHRIAMAFMVLGRGRGCTIEVDDPACTAVSFPGFAEALAALEVA